MSYRPVLSLEPVTPPLLRSIVPFELTTAHITVGTTPLAILVFVTAPFFSCFVPTLFFGD